MHEMSSRISHDRETGRVKNSGMLISLINRELSLTVSLGDARLVSDDLKVQRSINHGSDRRILRRYEQTSSLPL